MSEVHRSPMLGLALAQGVLSLPALKEILQGLGENADEAMVLAELGRRGLLDEASLDELRLKAELRHSKAMSNGGDGEDQTDPGIAHHPSFTHAREMTDPWASLPQAVTPGNQEGREVLRVLSLPRWKHYRSLRFVAEGGMGRIFKAFDPELKRMVALKFLRRDDPDLAKRFAMEAQSQARVDHPHICKVFEVGEWKGQHYIAMQFIKGESLSQAKASLSLEQKLDVMVKVAEAVHAAHRQGLIHRDLKPANIMVETGDDGALTPYVLDFGLARGMESSGITVQGAIIGTMHYMSPEQARCEHDLLTRRSDVYALGATLFDLLAGEPPFADSQGMDCLRRILEDEIPPLRAKISDLPEDLETIVAKCLEKDPARRYESARALAEDLRRFRDSEPILARPATLMYRAEKFARKNRALVAVASVGLVAVLLLGGFGLYQWITASRRAHWAQHFGQEAERIEALVRYGKLAPPHDLGRELAAAKQRMGELESSIRGAGSAAKGPGAYALGRSWLAVGDAERARTHLEDALRTGFRTPDVSYALGSALGRLYQRELNAAQRITEPEVRRGRIKEIEKSFKEPALHHLRSGRGANLVPIEFQEGLVALYAGRSADALEKARTAFSKASWYYEAKVLEAESLLMNSRGAPDISEARTALESAEHALQEARSLAPSDPWLLELETRCQEDLLRFRSASEKDLDHLFKAVQGTCIRWSAVEPWRTAPHNHLAQLYCQWGHRNFREGRKDPSWLEQAGTEIKQALQLDPEDPEAWTTLSIIKRTRAAIANHQNLSSLPLLEESLQAAKRALTLNLTRPETNLQVLKCYVSILEDLGRKGGSYQIYFSEARDFAKDLSRQYPDIAHYSGTLGSVLVELANNEFLRGQDPRPLLAEAIPLLANAQQRNPLDPRYPYGLANAHLIRAELLLRDKVPADAELEAARKGYRTSLTIARQPDYLLGLTMVEELAARQDVALGRDPEQHLASARTTLEQAALGYVDYWMIDAERARLELVRASWLKKNGRSVQEALSRAEAFLRRASEGKVRRMELEASYRELKQLKQS